MPFFKEEAFREFAKEFKNQKEPGGDWEFYVKTGDFSIYRRPALERNPNLFQYRSIGEWRNVKPETLANVYLDLNFRKKWDKNMASHAAFSFKEDKEETNGSHFEMKYPWPMSNRDYAYTIEKRVVKDEDGEYQVILGESLPPASFPGRKGVIRIDTYMQNICIAPSEDGEGCKVFMDYFDDPKGSIPKQVINWAAKSGVPTFINNLREACLRYQKEHPSSEPLDSSSSMDI